MIHSLLLVGPTGSGKTPLGELLAKRGLWGRRCFHFDFGAEMRRITENKMAGSDLTEKDLEVIRDSLQTGALLENKTFSIAEKILRSFLRRYRAEPEDIIILNGLPRHVGQAEDIESTVSVRMVVELACSVGVIRERILRNAGGDRTGRQDDALKDIERKWTIFQERTVPLLEYYAKKGVRVVRISVGVETRAGKMAEILEGFPEI